MTTESSRSGSGPVASPTSVGAARSETSVRRAGVARPEVVGALLVAGDEHQVVAAVVEPVGDGRTDAGAGTGDRWVRHVSG